jgi:hypothetical protein
MLEWWAGLGKPAQYGVALLVLGIGTFFLIGGSFIPLLWAVGGVLLCAAIPLD